MDTKILANTTGGRKVLSSIRKGKFRFYKG